MRVRGATQPRWLTFDALGTLDESRPVAVDLFLTYRALQRTGPRCRSLRGHAPALRRSILVREQARACVQRRAQKELDSPDRRRALELLEDVEQQQGRAPKRGLSDGLQGSVGTACEGRQRYRCRGFLRKALAAYRRGFEAIP